MHPAGTGGSTQAQARGAVRRLGRRDRLLRVIALTSAAGAVVAGSHPTGSVLGDLLVPAVVGGAVALAGSRARRWSLLVASGTAAAVAPAGPWWALAVLALIVSLAQVVVDRRDRMTGALVAAAAVQGLLRSGDGGTLVVAAATLAAGGVVVSGYRAARASERRTARRALSVGCVAAALAGLAFLVVLLEGRADLARGVDLGERGLEAMQAGDGAEAEDLLGQAADAFESAEHDLGSPLLQPARLFPVIGPHATAARQLAQVGGDIAAAAEVAAAHADYEQLAIVDGTVDLAALGEMRPAAREALDRLRAGQERADGIDRTGLVALLGHPLARLDEELDATIHRAESVVSGLDTAPWLLGADAPRRYLVVFGSPAEARGLGGFLGSYGLLTADRGRLTLERTGPIGELEQAAGWQERTLSGPPEFLARYGRHYPARFLKNASASPDFPTVASVLTELVGQGPEGERLDGVLYLDPYAVAALLEVTGPVRVEGIDEPLTADRAPALLLREQYRRFPDLADRRDVLASAATAAFEELTTGSSLEPGALAEALTPIVRKGRFLASVTDPAGQSFLGRLGLDGSFPAPDGRDFLSVRTANAAANKLDAYLARDIDYRVTYDPTSGAVEATLVIRLTNEAPEGLPEYVAGNAAQREGRPGPPAGTNLSLLSVYSALGLVGATVDGATLPVEVGAELGHHVYTAPVEIPQGATVTVEVDLVGTIDASSRYQLRVAQQPLVIPDEVEIEVEARRGEVRADERRTVVGPADALVDVVASVDE
jgi:hypothetical protein